jgi:NADP-dependent aldehyde dehydrogenase
MAQIESVTWGASASAGGFAARAALLETRLEAFTAELTTECFGPLAIVVRYADRGLLAEAVRSLPGALTATLHAEAGDPDADPLLAALRGVAGRVIWNGYPTGVGVTWAMHHGGPWPAAADARQTSVGAYSIRRWVRPVSWQGVPEDRLPDELRDDFDSLPRRVDGVLHAAASNA